MAQTRPSTLPVWATSGDITVPSSPKQAVGWEQNESPPRQYFNWYQNLAYQWLAYSDQKHMVLEDLSGGTQSYIVSGWTWGSFSSLQATLATGTLQYKGKTRLVLAVAVARTFTASKDTYVNVNEDGTLEYQEVANGAGAPTPSTNYVAFAKVITNGSAVTSATALLDTTHTVLARPIKISGTGGDTKLGTSTAAALCEGAGTLPAVRAVGATGYSLSLGANTTRAPLHLDSLVAEPSVSLAGDLYFDSFYDHLKLRKSDRFVNVWAGGKGFGNFYVITDGEANTTNGSGSAVHRMTLAINEIPFASKVLIEVRVRVGHSIAGNKVGIILYNTTDSATVSTDEFRVSTANGAADDNSVCYLVEYTLPTQNNTSISFRFYEASGSGTAYIRQASLRVLGFY